MATEPVTEPVTGTWEEVILDPDYEINTEFPYLIKKKSNGRIIKECVDTDGYVYCYMNQKKYKKHRIIAEQWLENDDPVNKTQVDHVNRNRTDNHISNLRWCSASENNSNRSGYGKYTYQYFDEIPLEEGDDIDDIIEVNEYGKHNFDNLYFYNNLFWIYNGLKYRSATIYYDKAGYAYVKVFNTNHKLSKISYIKFKNSMT